MKQLYRARSLCSVVLCVVLLIVLFPAVHVDAEASIMLLQPANGAKNIQVANDLVTQFVSETYTLTACDKYFDLLTDKFAPANITFKWKTSGTATALHLAENKSFQSAQVYAVSGNQLVLNGLKSQTTYYWKVVSSNSQSSIFSFTTGNGPRTVNIEGVTNTRDIGGWSVEGGEKIKQGVVYRTARLDNITAAGVDYCVNVLGIKTELDLRKPGEGVDNLLGNGVKVINISSPYYVGDGSIYAPENFKAMRQIMQVFADKKNYPILFHCTVGRDRTGCVAFLLEALCGMSPADIYREYDLSLFSANGDHAPSVMHKSFFTPTFKKMIEYGDGSLAKNTEQYMLDIGLTKAEINAIKANLIEYSSTTESSNGSSSSNSLSSSKSSSNSESTTAVNRTTTSNNTSVGNRTTVSNSTTISDGVVDDTTVTVDDQLSNDNDITDNSTVDGNDTTVEQESTVEADSTDDNPVDTDPDKNSKLPLYLIIGGAVVAAGAAILAILVKKKRNKSA